LQEVEALARKRVRLGQDPPAARESGSGESAVKVAIDGLVTFGAPTQGGGGGVTVNFETLSHRSAQARDAVLPHPFGSIGRTSF